VGSLEKGLNLLKGYEVFNKCQEEIFENQHLQTNTFLKPIFGNQKS
jgi:hypothetical protein